MIRKVLFVMLFLFCSALSLSAQTVVAKASGTDITGSPVNSIATSTTLNISTGQLLHVTCHSYINPGTITVTDTGSANTFLPSPLGLIPAPGGLVWVETFYAKNTVASATDTVTCNFSSGIAAYVGVMAIQVSGLATSAPLDQHATGGINATNTVTSGSFTTTATHEIIIAGVGWNNTGITCTAGTNFTLENTPAAKEGCDEYWIVSSTQSGATAGMTFSGAINGAMSVMTFSTTDIGLASPTQAGAFLPGP